MGLFKKRKMEQNYEWLGRNLIESIDIEVGGRVIRHMDKEDIALENAISRPLDIKEAFPEEVMLASWNAAVGPLAVQLFNARLDDASPFSLIDKDTIRTIIHYVYPKPVPEEHLYVPLQFWFNHGEYSLFLPPAITHTWDDRNMAIPLLRIGDLAQHYHLNLNLPAITQSENVGHGEVAGDALPINDLFD